MNLIIRIISTAILVMIIDYFMKGVEITNFSTAIIVALVLGLLNFFVKPILVILTLPITFFTLGFFYLCINAFIILVCAKLVDGFNVSSFWTALFFSIILSLSQSIVYTLVEKKK